MQFRKLCSLLWLVLATCSAMAQWAEPVKFTVSHKQVSDKEIVISFSGTIENGWHVYSTDVGNAGPIAATFNIDESKGLKPLGKLRALTKAVKKHDPVFDMDLSFHEGRCRFEQRLAITEPTYSLKGYLEYGACNDHNCLPPTAVEVEIPLTQAASGHTSPAADAATPSILEDEHNNASPDNNDAGNSNTITEEDDSLSKSEPVPQSGGGVWFGGDGAWGDSALWSSRVDKIKALSEGAAGSPNLKSQTSNLQSLIWLFLMGVVGGLIALLTPCVWPIIPMTVSFFLKRSENAKRGVRDAVIYGLSIIVIYMALAVIVTLAFGANAANALSTNAVVNIFFFLLLVAFGVSLLGFFEMELPSSWSNKADRKAEKTAGVVSIFIMAFTLALVSFSCTGPIIGFMLVEVAAMGNIAGPLVCMFGFALALALPFTLFALFPSVLKKMPKSGSWMNTVKVVLGFVEIAFALKFLSVADMAYGWHLLSRETFIIIWIILALALALWLLGVLKLPIDGGARSKRNVFKTLLAIVCLAFAAYMVPGVLGKPLKAISAFAPPMSTQHIRLYGEQVEARFTDYDEGMAYARQHGKRVLLDFTGFGCVNCREMEMNVWNDPQVAGRLRDSVVLISLFVDDKTSLPSRLTVEERGRTTTLRTVGDKWSYLQRRRFGANVQPFYILTDPSGEPIAPPYSYDTSVENFIRFLRIGENN